MELNPNHPVTSGLHDHWHKVLAIVMKKHGIAETLVRPEDIDAIEKSGRMPTILAHDTKDGLWIKLFASEAEAIEHMAKHQGRG